MEETDFEHKTYEFSIFMGSNQVLSPNLACVPNWGTVSSECVTYEFLRRVYSVHLVNGSAHLYPPHKHARRRNGNRIPAYERDICGHDCKRDAATYRSWCPRLVWRLKLEENL